MFRKEELEAYTESGATFSAQVPHSHLGDLAEATYQWWVGPEENMDEASNK